MTAIIAHKLHDRVELLTDTASYDGAGVIREFDTKITRLGGLRAVMTGRGKHRELHAFEDKIAVRLASQARTFDMFLHAIRTNLPLLKPLANVKPFDIVLAGISEIDGPAVYSFASQETEDGWPAFELRKHEHGYVFGQEMPPYFHAHLLKNGGLRKEGLRGLDDMRNGAGGADEDGVERVIGGEAELTTVSAAGILTEVIHEWDDVIGERIRPSASDLSGMSRQQRRAMARQQRRKAV